MKTLYTTNVRVSGGRDGRAVSDDGVINVPLALPAAIGGKGGATNPEQLFAAGFAACFNSSLRFAAKGMGIDPGDVTVAATVSLIVSEAGAYGIATRISAHLPDVGPGDRDAVMAEARRICAYSNAVAGTATTDYIAA